MNHKVGESTGRGGTRLKRRGRGAGHSGPKLQSKQREEAVNQANAAEL